MSGILDMIASQMDDQSLRQLGGQLGANQDALSSAIAAALPMLLGGLERNARSASGAESLSNALERDHDGNVLNDLSGFFNQRPTPSDTRAVDHILGPRRQAAEQALSRASGLDLGAVGTLLANLAPVVMGALGQQSRSGGFDAGKLAGMLGGETRELSQRQPSAMGSVDQLLDADGDGDVDISDLAQMGSGLLGGLLRR